MPIGFQVVDPSYCVSKQWHPPYTAFPSVAIAWKSPPALPTDELTRVSASRE